MANITVDIQARVTGYQKSLSDLQSQIQKLDPGASISKNVTKAFEQASNEVKGLSKNMFPKASSDTQIDAIVEKANHAGEAIQNVVRLLQQVTVNDLNFGNFGTEIDSFRSQIAALEQDLNTKLNQGLLSAVQGSQQLKDVFAGLGTDLSKADANTLFQDLSKGAQDAAGEVKKAQAEVDAIEKKLNDTQLSLNKNKQSILATQEGRTNLDADIKGISDSYNNIFDSLRSTMEKGLSSALKGQNVDTKGMLDTFFKDLTPENIKGRIQELFSQLSGSFNGAREFYKAVFGADDKAGSNINNLVNSIDLRGSIEAVKAQFQDFLAQNGSLIKPDQLPKITRLIDTDSINEAVQKTINEFDSAFGRVQKAIQEDQEKLITQTESRDMAQKALVEAQTRQSNYDTAITNLQTELDKVKAENENLVKQIADLRAVMEQQKGSKLEGFKSTAGAIGRGALQNVFPIDEANAYKQQLDQVDAKEQALGKLQGVVQRWFSIYAAIRMVRQAIDSVISTIGELDATITEIAIVTSMDQTELWDQMPKYTQLARDYAASISGVYQVSQLYYQQGLQTADVMALTEQTLKMARISGLDYAQATDYMTNAVRSFKMEMTDAQRVVDVYSAIAASSATSVTELASAMSKTASSAQAVGSSFENTTAMMAVMIEATRESAENIGSAMKSIISRYGEMTSDPSKLVDSEGQEMSLNRVDKALQTVGISIHNAVGEFRNFDEVIMELAQKWNTIDTNTQRYIATIMAGNRQQSRFLALVSSYDRLRELSAEAADSEDASQLQFLKTLDSVEAKTQQFQTSVQALYVNSGIEDLYKGILDWANKVITSLDQLSDKFGLLASVGKVSATFTSLATLVTNLFTVIKMSFSRTRAQISAEAELEAANRALAEESAMNRITNAYEREKIDYQNNQQQMTEASKTEAQKRVEIAQNEVKKTQGSLLNSKTMKSKAWGMGASAAGLAMTTIGASMDVNTQRQQKAWIGGIGSALSGIGTGFMIGGGLGAVVGILAAMPGIIEALGLSSETTAEKVSRLQNTLTEATNARIKSQDELKTLTDYKKKYEEAYAARNNSNEAYEEYIKLNQEIAAAYPTLISGMDEEGNYLVELTTRYESLLAIKQQVYNADFIKEGKAQIETYGDTDALLSLYGYKTLGTYMNPTYGYSGLGGWFQSDNLLGEISHSLEQMRPEDLSTQTYSAILGNSLQSISGAALTTGDIDKVFQGYSNINAIKDLSTLYDRGLQHSNVTFSGAFSQSAQLVNDLLFTVGTILDNTNGDIAEVNNELSQIMDTDITFNADLLGNIAQLKAIMPAMQDAQEKIIKSLNISAVSNSIQSLNLEVDSLSQDWINDNIANEWEDFKKTLPENTDLANAWSIFILSMDDMVQEAYSSFDFYKDLTTNQVNQVKSLYKNSKDYSMDQMASSLDELDIVNEDLREFILSTIMEDSQFLINQFKTGFTEKMAANKITTINGMSVDSLAADFSSKFGASFLNNILNHYDTILSNTNLTTQAKSSLLDTLTTLYTSIQDNTEFTLQEQIQLLSIINNADLTSSTGIDSLIKTIENKEIDIDETSLLANLVTFKETLVPNINAEIQSYFSSIENAAKDYLTAISSAEKGMDMDTAKEMAQKLGKTLADFRVEQGKFYYDDYKNLREAYLPENIKKEEELIQSTINKYQTISDYSEEFWSEINNGEIAIKDLEKVIDQNTLFDNVSEISASTLSTEYAKYKNELINNTIDKSKTFLQYLTDQIHAEFQEGKNLNSYISQNTEISLIKSNKIDEFIHSSSLITEALTISEDQILSQYVKQRAQTLAEDAAAWNSQLEKDLIANAKSEAPEDYYKQAEVALNKARGISESELNALAEMRLQKNQNQLNTILEEEKNRDFQAEAEDKQIQNGGTSLEDIQKEAKRLNDRDFTESENIQLEEYYQRFNDNVEEAENAFIQDRLSQLYTSRAEQIAQIKADLIQQSTDRIQKAQEKATWDASLQEVSEEWEAIYDPDLVRERAQQLADEAKAFNKQMADTAKWKPTDPEFYMAQAMDEIKQEQDAAIQAQAEQWAQSQIDLAKEGRFSEIESDTVKQHAALIYDTYHSINESIANSMISAIGDGEGLIKVTETNQDTLEKLKQEHPGWLSGDTTVGSYITIAAEKLLDNSQQFEQFIATSFDTNADRIKGLTEFHNNQYKNSSIRSFDKVLTTENFAYEDLLNYLVNTKNVDLTAEHVANIPKYMETMGLAFNSVGEVIITNYEAWIKDLEWTANMLKNNPNASQEEQNSIQAKLDNAKHAQEQAIASGFDGILKDYSNISVESVEALANALGVSYEYIISYLTSNGNGTYQLDTSKLPALLSELNSKVSQATIDSIEKSISSISDTYLSNIKNATSYTTKGASSLADVETFRQSYADIVHESLNADAFQYDSLTQSFVLDPAAMHKYINAQKKILTGMGYTEEFVNAYITDQTDKAIQASIELDSFLNANTSKQRNDEANKLIQQIRGLSNYETIQHRAAALASSKIQNIVVHNVEELQKKYDLAILDVLESGGQNAVDLLKKIKPNASADELSSAYSNAINRLNDALSDAGEFMKGSMINTTSKLYQVLSTINPKGVNADGVITAAYDMVKVYAAIYAEMTKTAGATTAGLNDAYAQLLTAQDQTNIDITETLKNGAGMSYADFGSLLAKYDIKFEDYMREHWDTVMRDGFGNIRITDWKGFAKNIFKTDDLDAIKNTDEYISAFKAYNDGLIELNKNTEEAITEEIRQIADAKAGDWLNLSELWTALGDSVAEKDWNAYLGQAQNNEKIARAMARQDWYKTIPGQLEQWGATFENGILKLGDNVNLLGIAQTLESAAKQAGLELGNGLEEVKDTILDVLGAYSEAITNGIKGGLDNFGAQDLRNKADNLGISNINFQQTIDGLKLSQQSAIELYQAIAKVDAIQGNIVFKELSESLKESNENFTTTSALLSHIKDLTLTINQQRGETLTADERISEARLKQYEAELEVAKEIVAVRSATEDKSFNFMDNKIPAGQNNPLNYAKNWTKAAKAINDAYKVVNTKDLNAGGVKRTKTGYMGYEDFYNIVNEINNMAGIMKKPIAVGKTIQGDALELDGSLESASDLILKGINTLTAVDTGDMMVNIGALGINLAKGGQDLKNGIDQGIASVADAQIAALDGMIAMLELIVAMEELGDITGEDMTIDLPDIAIDDDDDKIPDRLNEQYVEWLEKFDELYITNKQLKQVVDGIVIDGMSWRDWLHRGAEQWSDADAQILNALYQAAVSTDWNLDDIGGSLQELLNSGKFAEGLQGRQFTIDIGDITYTISNGVVVEVADWSNEQAQEVLKQYKENKGYGKNDDAKARAEIASLIQKYLEGEGATSQDLSLTDIIKIRHSTLIKHDEQGDYIEGPNRERYDPDSSGWNEAVQAAVLRDQQGINPKDKIKYDSKTKESTVVTEYGIKNTIKMKATVGVDGKVTWLLNDNEWSKLGGGWEGFKPNNANTQAELLDQLYNYGADHALIDDDAEGRTISKEAWIYQNFGIHIKVQTEVYKDGQQITDPTHDPKFREDAKSLIQEVKDKGVNAIENIISDGQGKTTITTKQGYTIQLDTNDISYDGKNIDQDLLAQKLEEVAGIDGALKDTIAAAIKDALTSLTDLEPGNLPALADGLTKLASALTALASVDAGTIGSIIQELSKLSGEEGITLTIDSINGIQLSEDALAKLGDISLGDISGDNITASLASLGIKSVDQLEQATGMTVPEQFSDNTISADNIKAILSSLNIITVNDLVNAITTFPETDWGTISGKVSAMLSQLGITGINNVIMTSTALSALGQKQLTVPKAQGIASIFQLLNTSGVLKTEDTITITGITNAEGQATNLKITKVTGETTVTDVSDAKTSGDVNATATNAKIKADHYELQIDTLDANGEVISVETIEIPADFDFTNSTALTQWLTSHSDTTVNLTLNTETADTQYNTWKANKESDPLKISMVLDGASLTFEDGSNEAIVQDFVDKLMNSDFDLSQALSKNPASNLVLEEALQSVLGDKELELPIDIETGEIDESKVSEFITKIQEYITQTKTSGQEIGNNLDAGAAEGISGQAGQVETAVDSLAKQSIEGRIKQNLGIASPSTVMKTVGENTVEGLIEGLSEKNSDLQEAVEELVTIILETFNNSLETIGDALTTITEKIDGLAESESWETVKALILQLITNLTTLQNNTAFTILLSKLSTLALSGSWQIIISRLTEIISKLETLKANSAIDISISLDSDAVSNALDGLLEKINAVKKAANLGGDNGDNGGDGGDNGGNGGNGGNNGSNPPTQLYDPSNTPTQTSPEPINATGTVKLTPEIDGDIEATGTVKLSPQIDGDITAKGTVTLAPKVEGDVTAQGTATLTPSVDPIPLQQGRAHFSASVDQVPNQSATANYTCEVSGLPGDVYCTAHYTVVVDGGVPAATGNVALATGTVGIARASGTQKTLMGELGPELVVSHGMYRIVGNEGPEMVSLARDAIVFNHLQTEQLLKNGRTPKTGRAITNEREATSLATGNFSGAAMASASAALAQLKALKALWESLAKASISDLVGAAGSGGGGGGGGGGKGAKIVNPSVWVATVERWYNLTQKIAKLEKDITHEQTLRSKLSSDWTANGKQYYQSQKRSLQSLQQEITAQEQLNLSRRDYYNKRVEALKKSPFGKLYSFDEDGQMKMQDGAMKWLTDLYGFDSNGKANHTDKEKYEILQKAGYGSYMKYDSNGAEIKMDSDNDGEITDQEKEDFYSKATQAYKDRMDDYAQETQNLYDEIREGEDNILEKQAEMNEITKEIRDNQMSVEESVLKAIEDMRQREIDALQDERDKLEESTGKYIEGLSNALDKEQEMYETQESVDDLNKSKRRLAILERSGGSAEDIASLRSEINSSERDLYFDLQQQQIDAIQAASDLEIERMDNQIQIMTDTLEYQKEYGLLWGEVSDVMQQSAADITSFIHNGDSGFWSKSPLASADAMNSTLFQAEQWTEYRDDLAAAKESVGDNKVTAEDIKDNVSLLVTMERTQLANYDFDTFNDAMKAEYGKDWDKDGTYRAKFKELYNSDEGGDLTAVSAAIRQQYEDDQKALKGKKNKARKAAWEAFISKKGNSKYDSKAYKKIYYAEYDKNGAESAEKKVKAQYKKDQKSNQNGGTGSSGDSGSVGSGCNSACTGECQGECTARCATACKGNTKSEGKGSQTCQSTCTGVCSWDSQASPTKSIKVASGGYVKHGYYELGERGTETVLTAQQTKILRDNILSNRTNSLMSLLKSYNEHYSDISTPLQGTVTTEDNSVNIDHIEMTMQVQQIANDYDAQRAGEEALNEMMRIARKYGATNSVRR